MPVTQQQTPLDDRKVIVFDLIRSIETEMKRRRDAGEGIWPLIRERDALRAELNALGGTE